MIQDIDNHRDLLHNQGIMSDSPPIPDVFWQYRTIRFFLDTP